MNLGYGHKEPIKVRLIDLVVLLGNSLRAKARKDVGFEDANQSLLQLLSSLNREVPIELADLESMLWSCGLMAEQDEFWHPRGLWFDSFVQTVIGRDRRMDPKVFVIKEKKHV